MAQVSQISVDNVGFSAFRTAMNNSMNALNTLSSGTSAPASLAAGSLWLDTTSAASPTLKYYDGSDSISLCTIDHSANTVNWLDSTVTADLVGDTSPQLGGQLDVNGNAIGNGTLELLKFSETGSAVNELTIANAATTNDPTITASGTDSNVGLGLVAKGTGVVQITTSMNPTISSTGKSLVMGF